MSVADAARILKLAQAMYARRNRQPWAKVFPEFKQHWIDAATHAYPLVERMVLEDALAICEAQDSAHECVADIQTELDRLGG